MNKDKVKEILNELGITPKDNWQTLRKFKDKTDTCYYHTFEHKGKMYCVSGDSISYCFSNENNPFDMIYAGYSIDELKKAIKGVVKNAK